MRRRLVILAGLLAVLVIGAVAALRGLVGTLRGELMNALGPGAQVGALEVGLRRLAVDELLLPGGTGWPADAALRAERVAIAPSLRSLLSSQIRIASVEVARPYVSMVRTRDGRLRIVPTLLERAPEASGAPRPAGRQREPQDEETSPSRSVRIRRIVVSEGEVDLYDASVATPPWRIRLIGLDVGLESVTAPTPSGRSPLDVSATIDGPSRDGTVVLEGWVDPTTNDLDLTARLRGVDLLVFRPYVTRSTKARLTGGQFDLDLHATVRDGRLKAPGHVVLADLAFAPGGHGNERVMGVPRDLLLAALAAQHGRLAFDFELAGDVHDPRFSLNETVATRVAVGLVESLGGLSVPGLVEGVTGAGGATLHGAEKLQKGVDDALKSLLRRRR